MNDDKRLLWKTSIANDFNKAVIVATTDAEETLLTPSDVPRVGADPVLLTVLLAITNHLDGVTALIITRSVMIDTALIAVEITVDEHDGLEGTVLDELLHHLGLADQEVGVLALALVSVPVKLSVASAVLDTLRSVGGSVASRVWVAILGHDTVVVVVVPGALGLATLLAVAAGAQHALAAAGHVLSRETADLVLVDALTVAHALDGTEGPAGAALLLVADLADGGAVGPLEAGIEGLGKVPHLFLRELLRTVLAGKLLEVVDVDAEEAAGAALGHACDVVVAGLPAGLHGVDLLDHLGADGDLLTQDDRGQDRENDELPHVPLI